MIKKVCMGIIVLTVIFNIPNIIELSLNAFNIFYSGSVSGKGMVKILDTSIDQFTNNEQIFIEVAERFKDFPRFSRCSKKSNNLPESILKDKELMNKIYFILNDLDFNEISLYGDSDDLFQNVYFEKSKQYKFSCGIYYLIQENSSNESIGAHQVKINNKWGYAEYIMV